MAKKLGSITPDNLIPIKDAGKIFGKGWGRNSILRRIDNGELKEGYHWINDGLSGRRLIKLVITSINEFRASCRR